MGVSAKAIASPRRPFCESLDSWAGGDVGLRSFATSFLLVMGPASCRTSALGEPGAAEGCHHVPSSVEELILGITVSAMFQAWRGTMDLPRPGCLCMYNSSQRLEEQELAQRIQYKQASRHVCRQCA